MKYMQLMQLISDGKLYWWHPLALLVIALFVGITVANYLFRDESWEDLLTSKPVVSWTAKGIMTHNGFERYVATIFFTSLFVWGILIHCTIRFVGS